MSEDQWSVFCWKSNMTLQYQYLPNWASDNSWETNTHTWIAWSFLALLSFGMFPFTAGAIAQPTANLCPYATGRGAGRPHRPQWPSWQDYRVTGNCFKWVCWKEIVIQYKHINCEEFCTQDLMWPILKELKVSNLVICKIMVLKRHHVKPVIDGPNMFLKLSTCLHMEPKWEHYDWHSLWSTMLLADNLVVI